MRTIVYGAAAAAVAVILAAFRHAMTAGRRQW